MNDPKPLRIEDQIALQARNAELEKELMKLKAPNAEPWFANNTAPLTVIFTMIGAVVFLGFYLLHSMSVVSGPVCCYEISHAKPWGPFQLVEIRRDWSTSDESNTDKEFKTEEEGRAFMRQWNLKECK